MEAQLVGRPVEYRNAWQTEFRGDDGKQYQVRVLLYTVEPSVFGTRTMHQERHVAIAGGRRTGGILEPEVGNI